MGNNIISVKAILYFSSNSELVSSTGKFILKYRLVFNNKKLFCPLIKRKQMCGIAGSVNFKLPYEQVNNTMLHRGPDEQNGFTVHNVDLYHLRLSIVDIASGKQPMQLDNRYCIIFNGEIYNLSLIHI